ncbi:kinesin-like protein subito [Atheta coriaria]|uniref:kinesin-like protein subito n=1 Tax=Dalotia coriaria TaxID=877792 RepID=UPI0031F41A9E
MAAPPKMSYFRARDPSLRVPANFNLLPRNLPEESFIDQDGESDSLNVYLRIKDTGHDDNLYEITENFVTCYVPEGSASGRHIKDGEHLNRIYTFTKIFPTTATQIELFNNVVKTKVLKCMNGINANLFTYGPSGSGKTYTIVGTTEEPGMIPQSLEYLFRSMKNLSRYPAAKPKSGGAGLTWLDYDQQQHEVCKVERLINNSEIQADIETHKAVYSKMQTRLSSESVASLDLDELSANVSIWISFAEIYNESVYDLLESPSGVKKPRKKLKIYNNNGETYIKDLKQVYVSNGHDAYCILQHGLLNLNYAATSMNSHSSRSHCVFTITLVQSTSIESNNFVIGSMNFCDLAGSERCKKTNNVGCRLNESNNINTSLLVLGRCISSIRKAQKTGAKMVIPFRESKLTQLFQKALQGLEDISMIVAMNPDRRMCDETIHALNFSAIAKEITLDKASESNYERNTYNSDISTITYERTIDILQKQVSDLTAELQEERMNQYENACKVSETKTEQFKKKFYQLEERYKSKRLETEFEMNAKDELIEALQQEIQELKEALASNDTDNSVISISSCEDNDKSISERITSMRYDKLQKEFADLQQEKYLLELKVEEQQTAIQQLCGSLALKEELLQQQKCDIIKLMEENACLDNQVEQSIRYSNIIRRDFEDDETSSLSSLE